MKIVWNIDHGADAHAIIMSLSLACAALVERRRERPQTIRLHFLLDRD
jgi:hypothetical protein